MGAGSRAPLGLSPPHSTLVPTSGGSACLVPLPSATAVSMAPGLHHNPCLTAVCPAQQAPRNCLYHAASYGFSAPSAACSVPRDCSSICITRLHPQPCLTRLQPAPPCLSPFLLQHGRQEVSVLSRVEKPPRARGWCLSFSPCSCSTVPCDDSVVTPQLLSPALCPSPAVGTAWSPSQLIESQTGLG